MKKQRRQPSHATIRARVLITPELTAILGGGTPLPAQPRGPGDPPRHDGTPLPAFADGTPLPA